MVDKNHDDTFKRCSKGHLNELVNPTEERFCGECGECLPLVQGTDYCPNCKCHCGKKNQKFCRFCGSSLREDKK